jgi:hypothetical protein
VSGVLVRVGPGQGGAAMGRRSVTLGVGVVVIILAIEVKLVRRGR